MSAVNGPDSGVGAANSSDSNAITGSSPDPRQGAESVPDPYKEAIDASAQHLAQQRHSCPACGASAVWDPVRKALVCPYCGTVSPYTFDEDTRTLREIALAQALRELPQELRGWQIDRHTVRCQSCNAVSVFEPGRVAQRCEFCGAPALVPYEEVKAPLRPQSLLPFEISNEIARGMLRTWYRGRWLAPGSLKRQAALHDIQGVYLPYWTFDAHADCPWTADSGTYYTTTERVRDPQGRMVTRPVQKVRWTPASGHVRHFFDDELVCGSTGVDASLLSQVKPFPTDKLVPYDTGYLSGFVVEHYQTVLLDAAQNARAQMEARLRELCAAQVPGDTHRNLRISPTWSGETFKLVLLPVWVLGYRYRGRTYQAIVNGRTGLTAGRYPKSAWKIFFIILVALAIVAAIYFM